MPLRTLTFRSWEGLGGDALNFSTLEHLLCPTRLTLHWHWSRRSSGSTRAWSVALCCSAAHHGALHLPQGQCQPLHTAVGPAGPHRSMFGWGCIRTRTGMLEPCEHMGSNGTCRPPACIASSLCVCWSCRMPGLLFVLQVSHQNLGPRAAAAYGTHLCVV